MDSKYNKLINEIKNNSSLSENEKEQRLNFISILEKGNKINKAFSKHLDKYISQYKQTGNVQL
mgnify:CR=1 FL=1